MPIRLNLTVENFIGDRTSFLDIHVIEIAASGSPWELKNAYSGDFVTLYGIDEETVRQMGTAYEKLRDSFRLSVPNTAAATALILKYPEVFTDYEITKGTMDDVFLAVTGKNLKGGSET